MIRVLTATLLLFAAVIQTAQAQQKFQFVKGGGGLEDDATGSLQYYEQILSMCTDNNRNLYVSALVYLESMTADTTHVAQGHYAWGPPNALLLASYRCDGTMRWSRIFEGSGDCANGLYHGGLVYDGAGSIYLSGTNNGRQDPKYMGTSTPTSAYDNLSTFLVKYDTSGNQQWLQFVGQVNGTQVNNSGSIGLSIDREGNPHNFVFAYTGLYIAPGVTSVLGTYDVKYSPGGTLLSATRLNVDTNHSYIRHAVISPKSNKIYAIMDYDLNYAQNQNQPLGNAIVAFDPSGNLLWKDTTRGYSGFSNLVYDGNNGIYACGFANDTIFTFLGHTVKTTFRHPAAPHPLMGNMGIICKVDTNGAFRWIYKNEANNVHGYLEGMALMGPDKVIAGGSHAGITKNGNDSIVTPLNMGFAYYSLLDTAGNHIKLDRINTAAFGGLYDNVTAITTDKAGSAYLGGWASDSTKLPNGQYYKSRGGYSDFFIAKYGFSCCSSLPSASYTAAGTGAKTVQFTYTGTTSGIDSLVWRFGDGQTQKVTSAFTTPVSHTYAANGSYGSCVTVYSACGLNTYCRQNNVGVSNINALAGVNIYPNPTTDNITIEGAQSGSTLSIFNVVGQQLLSAQISSNKQVVSLGHLPAGSYLIQLRSVDGVRGSVTIIRQ